MKSIKIFHFGPDEKQVKCMRMKVLKSATFKSHHDSCIVFARYTVEGICESCEEVDYV